MKQSLFRHQKMAALQRQQIVRFIDQQYALKCQPDATTYLLGVLEEAGVAGKTEMEESLTTILQALLKQQGVFLFCLYTHIYYIYIYTLYIMRIYTLSIFLPYRCQYFFLFSWLFFKSLFHLLHSLLLSINHGLLGFFLCSCLTWFFPFLSQ